MARNVVVCCDGTANEFAHDRTNVIKLFSTLRTDSSQLGFYHPGIGTMEPFGSLSPLSRRFTRLLGMAFGYGLENDIRDAYVFLMKNCEPDDHVYLFGFSRGAYTVRAVAALLFMYGLILRDNEPLVPYAIRMMMAKERSRGTTSAERYFSLAKEFRKMMTRPSPRIRFVGVWDTVSSVGWVSSPVRLPYTANNPLVEKSRHAISIDEHRAFFRSNLWRPNPNAPEGAGPADLTQVWFPGVHCDVGGGYLEQEAGLSKYPLKWMIEEATDAGLLFETTKVREVLGLAGTGGYVESDPQGLIHKSLHGLWHIAEFIPKLHWNNSKKKNEIRPNLYGRRTIPENSFVHESAWLRGGGYKKRLPATAIRYPPLRDVSSPEETE